MRTRLGDGRSYGETQQLKYDWENLEDRMLALRCKVTEVIWHEKVMWRKRGGCSGRCSGNIHDTGGSDMGDMCHEASGGGRK
jgi:hypothetical protein